MVDSASKNDPIKLGQRRELFWDDFLVEETTARLCQHHPVSREIVLQFNEPWEGNLCSYPVIFADDDRIRLYYLGINLDYSAADGPSVHSPVYVCYAESRDGGHSFVKPDLGLYAFNGNTHNNIILAKGGYTRNIDNFAVFKDTNPACRPEERYKAVAENGKLEDNENYQLCYYASSDGIHFTPGEVLIRGGMFDSLNTIFWDRHTQQYYLYMRDYHDGVCRMRGKCQVRDEFNRMRGMRGIRYATSPDFRNWSECRPLDFGQTLDVELYTNAIKPYPRADHLFLGMPTRYIERTAWSPNFEYLPDVAHRRLRSRKNSRYGTALTDCVLMTSRDGTHFRLQSEAFMTPGIERDHNWVYGDCYPAWGLIETASDLPDHAPHELSLYVLEYHWQQPEILRRHTIRLDGFFSYSAGYDPALLRTKLMIFTGNRLSINFATSAAGYIRIKILDENRNLIPGYESTEIFGDSLDRPVVFANGTDLSGLSGRPIRLLLEMSDAQIYSICFTENNGDACTSEMEAVHG